MKSIEPGSDEYKEEGILFVRVSDMSKFEITDPEICLSENIIDNVFNLFPKKDTILFSKDGSVGIAYKMENDASTIAISRAFLEYSTSSFDFLRAVNDSLIFCANSSCFLISSSGISTFSISDGFQCFIIAPLESLSA